jgi:hypothetical protein
LPHERSVERICDVILPDTRFGGFGFNDRDVVVDHRLIK